MSSAGGSGPHRKVTNWATLAVALAFVLVGVVLLFLSSSSVLRDSAQWGAFAGQLGGLLAATGLITFAWDLVGRRAFAGEVMAQAQLSADVVDSGLTRVTDQYLDDVQWSDLFRDVKQLDIVVAYGSTWRNTHRRRLEAAASRNCRIRIFLPDYTDPATMTLLAERFSMAEVDLISKVTEACADFKALATPGGTGSVEVRLRKGDLVFSCYRFDSQAVLTLYSHSHRRTNVPTFVMTSGSLFAFVSQELTALQEQSDPAP